ncbi:MAG: hypothetical protein OEZ06_07195 [Myxococcales bacterium]|nr:hypothetical protein [Myxococcales bacterium]
MNATNTTPTTLSQRDSSLEALAEIRQLREQRIAERERARIEAAKRLREQQEAQALAEAMEAVTVEAEAAPCSALETGERISRCTLERIGDLHSQLTAMLEAEQRFRQQRQQQLDAVVKRLAARPSRWTPALTGVAVACACFALLLTGAPQAPEAQGASAPTAPALEAEAAAEETLAEAAEVALLEEVDPPLLSSDAGATAADVAEAAAAEANETSQATTRRKPTRRRPANRDAKAGDALDKLDACGDDPLCGL